MEYIPCSNTQTVLEYVLTCIHNSRVVMLTGEQGSGKSFLSKKSVADLNRNTTSSLAHSTVYAELTDAGQRVGKGNQVTAMTFTEIIVGLSEISEKLMNPLIHAQKQWYHRMAGTATPQQLATLYAFLRRECQLLHIRALIIDNATFLDSETLKRLIQLRRYMNDRLALIFCVQTEKPEAHSEYFSRILKSAMPHEEYEHPMSVLRPSERDTKGDILLKLLTKLNCDLAGWSIETVSQLHQAWWNATQGNWHQIMQYWRRADDLYGTRTVKQWLIKPNEWGHLMQA